MKVKFGFLLFFFLLLSACQQIDSVTIYKMKSFSKVDEEFSSIVIKESEDVKSLKSAFENAKKEPGIVNMADPQYKVEMGDEAFYLWINDESGTIMNLKDTHTIYTLSGKAVRLINGLLEK